MAGMLAFPAAPAPTATVSLQAIAVRGIHARRGAVNLECRKAGVALENNRGGFRQESQWQGVPGVAAVEPKEDPFKYSRVPSRNGKSMLLCMPHSHTWCSAQRKSSLSPLLCSLHRGSPAAPESPQGSAAGPGPLPAPAAVPLRPRSRLLRATSPSYLRARIDNVSILNHNCQRASNR